MSLKIRAYPSAPIRTTGGEGIPVGNISLTSSGKSCLGHPEGLPSVVSDELSFAENYPAPPAMPASFANPTDATIEKVFERDGRMCWACGLKVALDIAHVSSSETHWFNLYKSKNLVSFTHPAHEDNLIILCKNCKDQLDCKPQCGPGWIFLPESLSVFIDYEEADYASRVEAGKRGDIVPPRSVPATTGASFLYRRYVTNPDFTTKICPLKPWAGSPTASIFKAAFGIMSPAHTAIPAVVRREFAHLINLYHRQDPLRFPRSTVPVGYFPKPTGGSVPKPVNCSSSVTLAESEVVSVRGAAHLRDPPNKTSATATRTLAPVRGRKTQNCIKPMQSEEELALRDTISKELHGSTTIIPEDSVSQMNRLKAAPPVHCQNQMCKKCKSAAALPIGGPLLWGPGSSSDHKVKIIQEIRKAALKKKRDLIEAGRKIATEQV